ncbi:MAG: hypothetical protein Q8P12_05330, partial [bacterium]|nr:hypothetical protein [bacterium]
NSFMQKYILLLAIVALILIAVGLGYLIFQQYSPASEQGQEQEQGSELSGDAGRVLTTPGPDATEEERIAHFELARRMAQESDVLDLSACSLADPVVLKLTEGQSFAVKNDDEQPHTMVFNENTMHQIPAGGSIELTADFEMGPGLYGYGCDSVPRAVGLLFVEPEEPGQP